MLLALSTLFPLISTAQAPNFRRALTARKDSLNPDAGPVLTRTVLERSDTSPTKPRTDTFSLRLSKDTLDAPLKYQAADSAVILVPTKRILLYGRTQTDYKDIQLTAPKVELDQERQMVIATNRKDSGGQVIEEAHFKSGESEFSSDTILYNFQSQVGLTKNTYSQQGEILVIGALAKKVNENTTFIQKARFTTCLLDEPHFSFVTPKMKVVNQKLAVSGPAHPEFEGVPVPIYLPFGFYPLSQGRHSGFLPPQFTSNERWGLGLEGLGYYKVLNEYWDAKVFGNIYSYGGWSVNFNPTYRKRYRYSGNMNFSMQTTKLNFKGDPDYLKNKSFFLTWSHSVDLRARPSTRMSASVNAGSTQVNQLIPNNAQLNFQNQLGSSITYSKTWAGKPYNLTMSANHNQNNRTRLINLSLPDVGFTVNTLYPFQKKESVGSAKWYEKLGIGYNGNFRNQFSFYDSAFNFKRLIDTLQWGAQHNFPLTVALPPVMGGALIISPTISYSQVWVAQQFRRKWNTALQKVDTSINKGFYQDHQASFSLGFNTALFGTYSFKKSRVMAIRHVVRPSISMNYRPDLSRKNFYTDTIFPGVTGRFSVLEGGLYSGFAEGRTGGLGFQFDNNLEMKMRSRKDTGEQAIKKVKLIDGFGFTTGYNFLRDSMKLEPINLYFRTTLFDKISITANSVLDPYQTNERGFPINRYAWQGDKFKLGRLTFGSVAMNTTFRSKPKDEKKEQQRSQQFDQMMQDPNMRGQQQQLMEFMQQNPGQFVDFNIPWQLTLGYSLSFSNRIKPDYSGFSTEVNSNLNFSGSFNLTSKWNVSANGFYDVSSTKLQTFQMSINREMHCWQLSINVTPVGLFRSFNFSISPKASMLQDLRINRTRFFTNF